MAAARPPSSDSELRCNLYWSQWHLAIHKTCAGFDEATHSHEWEGRDPSEFHTDKEALRAEAGRLQEHITVLEAGLSRSAQARLRIEESHAAALVSITRLEKELADRSKTAADVSTGLEQKLSLEQQRRARLDADLQEAATNRAQLEARLLEQITAAGRYREAAAEAERARGAREVELKECREKLTATEGQLAALREKYSVVKRRLAEAGRKVESMRAEREGLRKERDRLQDQLADVEKFQGSERGQMLGNMEQELAEEKMCRVELEAERDELQSRLHAMAIAGQGSLGGKENKGGKAAGEALSPKKGWW